MAIIGVDIGTSVTKASLIDRDGKTLGRSVKPSRLIRFRDGRVEQDLDNVIGTVMTVVGDLAKTAENVEAISLTGQGDGLWLRDERGRAVRNPVSWMDNRAARIVEGWMARRGGGQSVVDRVYSLTGSGLFPGCAAPLMAWMADHEPESLDRACVAGYCIDSVVEALTGAKSIDASDASLPFLDVTSRSYVDEALSVCGVDQYRRLLLDPAPPGTVLAMRDDVAAAVGVPSGTPVIGAPFDIVSCAFGTGVSAVGDGSVALGTTLGCTVLSDRVALDPAAEPAGMWVCTPDPAVYMRMMPSMVGTAAVDWLTGLLGLSATDVDAELADSGHRAAGVRALSFLSPAGERAPFVDPRARGQLTGLSLTTRRADLVRALCEGIAYAARHCMEAAGHRGEMTVSGGGAASARWVQLIADVFGQTVYVSPHPDIGERGAALVGWAALGTEVAAGRWSRDRIAYRADPAAHAAYEEGFADYKRELSAAREEWTHHSS